MKDLRFSDYCANCRASLSEVEKVYFVEREMGRCFCSEECIRDYFQPTVEFMAEELAKFRSQGDFNDAECEQLGHYRLMTLQDPDEVWVAESESGERHFTFISHYQKGEERFSYVTVCLTIDGEPSFLFLGFPTRDDDLVDEYRRGIDLRVNDPTVDIDPQMEVLTTSAREAVTSQQRRQEEEAPQLEEVAEQVAQEHNEFERLYFERRRAEDIPRSEFPKFEVFVEPTLDEPDEIWSFVDDEANEWWTFIAKHFDDEGHGFNMVVVCQPEMVGSENREKAIEVVFAFPTIDPALVQYFRRGINSLNRAFGVGWSRGRAA